MKHRIIVSLALLSCAAMACDAQAFWGSRGSAGSYGGSYGGGSYGGGSYGGGSYGGSYGGSRGGLFSGRRAVAFRSAGSYGSVGGSYGSTGGSYGSVGGGSRGGLLSRLGSRLRSRGSAGSYGGSYSVSYGSTGSYGGGSYGGGSYSSSYVSSHSVSYGSHGGSSYSSGSYGSSYSTPAYESYSTPVEHTHSSDCGCSACTGANTDQVLASGETGNGLLRVEVPADAIVYVNGKQTTSTGTHRQYASYGLEANRSYSYEVRVEYSQNGQTVTETKQVALTAGSDEMLAFAPSVAIESVATKLQLHVPANAKVILSGVATKQTGEVREYVTTRLADGQKWNDYNIVVEYDVDGQTVTQRKTITLEGGKSQELAFVDNQGAKLAMNN